MFLGFRDVGIDLQDLLVYWRVFRTKQRLEVADRDPGSSRDACGDGFTQVVTNLADCTAAARAITGDNSIDAAALADGYSYLNHPRGCYRYGHSGNIFKFNRNKFSTKHDDYTYPVCAGSANAVSTIDCVETAACGE